MIPTIGAPYFLNFASLVYFIPAISLTLYYVYLCNNLLKTKKNKETNFISRKIFIYSILYLFSIFLLILIDSFLIKLYG